MRAMWADARERLRYTAAILKSMSEQLDCDDIISEKFSEELKDIALRMERADANAVSRMVGPEELKKEYKNHPFFKVED